MSKITEELAKGVSYVPAVVCFLVKDEKVLLGHRKKVTLDLGLNVIGGIGGKVGDDEENKNETPEEALVREVQEEIGVNVLKYKYMGHAMCINPNKPKWNMDVLAYIVYEWEGEPKETEVIKPEWFNISELPLNRMWHDNKYWVPRVLAGEEVNDAYLFDEDSKVVERLHFDD